jgi:hypothetical protein
MDGERFHAGSMRLLEFVYEGMKEDKRNISGLISGIAISLIFGLSITSLPFFLVFLKSYQVNDADL